MKIKRDLQYRYNTSVWLSQLLNQFVSKICCMTCGKPPIVKLKHLYHANVAQWLVILQVCYVNSVTSYVHGITNKLLKFLFTECLLMAQVY